MPERPSTRRPAAVNRLSSSTVGDTAEDRDAGKNPAAVALGRLGGKKGGLARAAKLTAAERQEIARLAARARWRRDAQ